MLSKGIIEITSKYVDNPSDTQSNYKMSLNNHVNVNHVWLETVSIPVTWNNVYYNKNLVSFTVDAIQYSYLVPPDYYDIFNLCQLLSAQLTLLAGVNITFANLNVPSNNCHVSLQCQLGHTYSFSFNSSIANLLGFPIDTLININPVNGYIGPYHSRNESFDRLYIFLGGAQVDASYTDQVQQDRTIAIVPVQNVLRGSNLIFQDYINKYYISCKSLNTFRVLIKNEYGDFIDFRGGNNYICINYC